MISFLCLHITMRVILNHDCTRQSLLQSSERVGCFLSQLLLSRFIIYWTHDCSSFHQRANMWVLTRKISGYFHIISNALGILFSLFLVCFSGKGIISNVSNDKCLSMWCRFFDVFVLWLFFVFFPPSCILFIIYCYIHKSIK